MRRPEDGHQIEPLYGAIGGPLYAVHYNGFPYAAFASPNQALMYWRGLSRREREWFHIEDAEGRRVRVEPTGHAGHAYAIIEAGG
jgi:hypothetical protein